MEDREQIFSDKITLSTILTHKIFNFVNQYNSIFRKLRFGSLNADEVGEDEDWQHCWQNMAEMYDFLEFEHFDEVHKSSSAEKKIVMDKLKTVVEKYRKGKEELLLSDLTYAQKALRYFTTMVGLHDVRTRRKRTRDMLEPEGEWN